MKASGTHANTDHPSRASGAKHISIARQANGPFAERGDRRRYAGNPGYPLATGDYFVITESEVTGNHVGDAPMLPELLDQVPEDQEIGMVTAPSHACKHALPGSGWCR